MRRGCTSAKNAPNFCLGVGSVSAVEELLDDGWLVTVTVLVDPLPPQLDATTTTTPRIKADVRIYEASCPRDEELADSSAELRVDQPGADRP